MRAQQAVSHDSPSVHPLLHRLSRAQPEPLVQSVPQAVDIQLQKRVQ